MAPLNELSSDLVDTDKRYQWMMSIAANIASASKVREPKVSPDGARVLYQVQAFYEDGPGSRSSPEATEVSQLWLANINNGASPRNAKKLFEDGPYNDRSGVWHPDSKRIVFVSDRLSGPGQPGQLVIADVEEGRERAVTTTQLKNGISMFVVEPVIGRFIAFTTLEPVKRGRDLLSTISDAKVYGESASRVSRLGVVNLETGDCVVANRALGPNAKEYIESIGWSPDSRKVLYRTRQQAAWEYTEQEVELKRVMVVNEAGTLMKEFGLGELVTTLSRSPPGKNLWLTSGYVATIQNYVPSNVLDAQTLFFERTGNFQNPGERDITKMYGENEDAIRMVDASCVDGRGQKRSLLAVEVANGVNTHIDVVETSEGTPPHVLATLHTTHNDHAVWSGAWDVRTIVDTAGDGHLEFVLAAVLTSAPRHEPPDVWAFRKSLLDLFEKQEPEGVPVSVSHLAWLGELPSIETEVVKWKTNDGTELDGLIRYPPGYRREDGPKPTVLHIHGGPYSRDIPDYTVYFCNWREFLAWAGYIVITPNFRGGLGRGHAFAAAANQGIGVHDWADCESMVDHFIAEGIADPARLGVAGWSHGGSLTAWGVSLTKNKFKAAVVGAGATNWEGMVAESVSPELESAVGQRNPWDYPFTELFKSSPIHHVVGVETAVLILHGEEDSAVPLGQAVGFFRGLKRKAARLGQETARLVTYPREPHGFEERAHVQDVLMRVFDYFQLHL